MVVEIYEEWSIRKYSDDAERYIMGSYDTGKVIDNVMMVVQEFIIKIFIWHLLEPVSLHDTIYAQQQ